MRKQSEPTVGRDQRMLGEKKILEWSLGPRDALATMIELNNRYALDGRDPSSYSGIFWVLGRYDRPWGPERPIFGHARYMSSENTAREVRARSYMERYRDHVSTSGSNTERVRRLDAQSGRRAMRRPRIASRGAGASS